MDVAAVFRALLEVPVFRQRLDTAAGEAISDATAARLTAIVFLHDIGKLHPGFQAKGWVDLPAGLRLTSHVTAGAGVFGRSTRAGHPLAPVRAMLAGWRADDLWEGILAHHGKPVGAGDSAAWPQVEGYDWVAAARDYVACWYRWFPIADAPPEPLPQSPAVSHLVAGLTMLADWIGSDRDLFPFRPEIDPDYPAHASRAAETALKAVGLTRGQAAEDTGFERLTGHPSPRPAQAAVGALEPDERLAILEAETGSGKTEAALWRFARLHAAGAVDGLYFAVPTRAAARQLHGRIVEICSRLFGEDGPEPVLAIPGQQTAGAATGRRLADWQVLWDDAPDPDRAKARWAAEHATRYLAARIAVGTIDQAMLAVLTVRHAHLRAAALSRQLLVVDEVHASDPYMTGVLSRLLDLHVGLGGHALLMSATLGSQARSRWLGTVSPAADVADSLPYPAVWTGSGRVDVAPEQGRGKTVAVDAVPDMAPERAAMQAMESARAGARVLVIRNTVDAAVDTWRAVEASGAADLLLACEGGPALHHGRFAAEDRARLDACVEAALAPAADRETGGLIAIGTQTLEQSLDIDADLLISDLCPMDVLLQRIGRLHRHRLPRPEGFEAARAVVLVPDDGLGPLADPPRMLHGLGAWKDRGGAIQGIYTDLACLELTRRLITAEPVWQIPAMNRRLVEGATHPSRRRALLEEMGPAWQRFDADLGGVDAAQRMLAGQVCVDWEEPFGALGEWSAEEAIRTRLGEDGVVLRLPEGCIGPFGHPIARIALPGHWSRGIETDEAEVEPAGDGIRLVVGARAFSYSRAGLGRSTSP